MRCRALRCRDSPLRASRSICSPSKTCFGTSEYGTRSRRSSARVCRILVTASIRMSRSWRTRGSVSRALRPDNRSSKRRAAESKRLALPGLLSSTAVSKRSTPREDACSGWKGPSVSITIVEWRLLRSSHDASAAAAATATASIAGSEIKEWSDGRRSIMSGGLSSSRKSSHGSATGWLHAEGFLVHRGDLLAQLEDPILPVALRAEPGKCGRKRWIAPAAREPRGVVDQPQRAQRFEQGQLAPVEGHEVLVARKQVGELLRHRTPVSREQHPEILQRRTHARVVEIDEVRPALGPQDVPRVAVAVQPDRAHLAGALVASCNRCQGLFRHRLPCIQQIGRNEVVREQPGARFMSKSFCVQGFSALKSARGSHRVDPADEPSNPFEGLAVLELGAAPAAARVHGEAEPGVLAGKGRRDDRNFMRGQFFCEGMLFRDLPRAPAAWAL